MNDFVKQPYKFGFPEKRGLYDPAMEKDSCGVGFVANIKLRPDAVGKCQQPFELSAYDQYRVEVHEDVLISEGKATWAPPGMALAFSSQLEYYCSQTKW